MSGRQIESYGSRITRSPPYFSGSHCKLWSIQTCRQRTIVARHAALSWNESLSGRRGTARRYLRHVKLPLHHTIPFNVSNERIRLNMFRVWCQKSIEFLAYNVDCVRRNPPFRSFRYKGLDRQRRRHRAIAYAATATHRSRAEKIMQVSQEPTPSFCL